MKPQRDLLERLEGAAQACHAAHILSCEATCREAAEEIRRLRRAMPLYDQWVAVGRRAEETVWDWEPRDQALIEEARRRVHALDLLGAPLDDPRRVISVNADTRRSWERRGMKVKRICGLKVIPLEET